MTKSVHEAGYLDVIAEPERLRVRREAYLVGDIGHAEERHVVVDERDGHHQRHEPMPHDGDARLTF